MRTVVDRKRDSSRKTIVVEVIRATVARDGDAL